MMHLFINSLAASAGGGLTYIRNVLPYLAAAADLRVTVALGRSLRQEFRGFNAIDFQELEVPAARRFWYEQLTLPGIVRRSGADILLSTGNFALRNSPVPQILLSRNSIYTSPDFYRDLRTRHEYRMWLETHVRGVMAKRSIRWADCTVAPSEVFAAELARWTGIRVLAIPHGFDREAFMADPSPLAPEVEQKLGAAEDSFKLLFVSHYNYYRNFETLIRALALLRDRLAPRRVCLILTCKLRSDSNPGSYSADSAAHLVQQLGLAESVIELGSIPYGRLHHLYHASHIYVTAAYAESFAHPLVEAMSSGLPIAAADTEVHREICGESALFFPAMSPTALADQVCRFVQDEEISKSSSVKGLRRSRDFTWKQHVQQLLDLAQSRFAETIAKQVQKELV